MVTAVPSDAAQPAVDMRSGRALAAIPDPEIPVISIVELGIVRERGVARRRAGRDA